MGLREQKAALRRVGSTLSNDVSWMENYPPVIESVVSSGTIRKMQNAILMGLTDALEECDEEGLTTPKTSLPVDFGDLITVRRWYAETLSALEATSKRRR